jgi:hypothetical protein
MPQKLEENTGGMSSLIMEKPEYYIASANKDNYKVGTGQYKS